MGNTRDEIESRSFLGGLLLGLVLSAPLAAWLSPYSGHRLRQEIRQRGQVVVRRAGQTAQQVTELPARIGEGVGQQVSQLQDQIGSQVEQIQDKVRGRESVDEALEEGRAIAARRRGSPPL